MPTPFQDTHVLSHSLHVTLQSDLFLPTLCIGSHRMWRFFLYVRRDKLYLSGEFGIFFQMFGCKTQANYAKMGILNFWDILLPPPPHNFGCLYLFPSKLLLSSSLYCIEKLSAYLTDSENLKFMPNIYICLL
ncbi:hypothetical protein FKM82_023648 [Ascaphus truei]